MGAFFKSFVFAYKGIKEGAKQRNLKIHFLFAILSILLGFYFSISITEWLMVCLCIGFVISLELINTAIEYLVNWISPEQHPMAGKIKDLGAGAVLIAAITAIMIGIVIFGKYIIALCNH